MRWSLGLVLVGLIVGAEVEEGHGVHIVLIAISCLALAGVGRYYQDRPRLSMLFAALGVLLFVIVAGAHLLAADWNTHWSGWLAVLLLGFIFVFLGRRFFLDGPRP